MHDRRTASSQPCSSPARSSSPRAASDDDDADDEATAEATAAEDSAATEAPPRPRLRRTEAPQRRRPPAPRRRPPARRPPRIPAWLQRRPIVDQFSDPNQPIGVTIPLTGVPEPKTIAWLECEFRRARYITAGIEAATEALGWELEIIPIRRAPIPARPSSRRSTPASTTSPARARHARCTRSRRRRQRGGDRSPQLLRHRRPEPATTNIQTQCGDKSFVEKTGPLMADWAIVDSGGAANVLVVSIPDFAGAQGRDRRLHRPARDELPRLHVHRAQRHARRPDRRRGAGRRGVAAAGQLRHQLRVLLVRLACRPVSRRRSTAPACSTR